MREILFRGRDISGQWHYGVPLMFNEDYVCIAKLNEHNKTVEYKTLGQYTGLTDKNGTKIFEGDIVDDQEFIGVVKYNEIIASFVVEINDAKQDYYHWSLLNMGDPLREKQLKYTEIVGNIYDNPELLKGIKNVQLQKSLTEI